MIRARRVFGLLCAGLFNGLVFGSLIQPPWLAVVTAIPFGLAMIWGTYGMFHDNDETASLRAENAMLRLERTARESVQRGEWLQ